MTSDTPGSPTPEKPAVPAGTWQDPTFEAASRGNDIFFAAVEKTRMPMIVTDPHRPDNPIIFANNAFIAMTGYRPEELLGRNCRFLQGPETDPGTVDELRAAIRERHEIATEILNYRRNGSSFWTPCSSRPSSAPMASCSTSSARSSTCRGGGMPRTRSGSRRRWRRSAS